MGSCLVEVLLILGDKPTKMLVNRDNHMVEKPSQETIMRNVREPIAVAAIAVTKILGAFWGALDNSSPNFSGSPWYPFP